MKAIQITTPGEIRLTEKEMPEVHEGEALLKVKYCGICGADVASYTGNQPFTTYPRIPGHEFSAEIVSVGENDKGLKAGDIITFISQDPDSFGEVITHKIRSLTADAVGRPGFVTYGTTTNTDDATVVTHEYVVGRYVGRIPNVGSFFQFLKTTPGYIICILIPFLLLILSQGLNCVRLFRQYKSEQMDEMKAERAKLEQERAESQRMMAELLELKARLAESERAKAHTPDPSSEDNKTDKA